MLQDGENFLAQRTGLLFQGFQFLLQPYPLLFYGQSDFLHDGLDFLLDPIQFYLQFFPLDPEFFCKGFVSLRRANSGETIRKAAKNAYMKVFITTFFIWDSLNLFKNAGHLDARWNLGVHYILIGNRLIITKL